MMILDFSKEFQFPTVQTEWEKSILDFIQHWFDESEYIQAQTSGSTGTPKPILLPKSAMKLSAQLTGEFFNLQQNESALLCLPVNFIAGKMMVVRAIELGLKLHCVEPKSQINLEDFPMLDFVPMTPMQVQNSLESLSKIKTLLIGGAPLSDSLRNELLKQDTKSYESYGMTETITHIGLKTISEEFFTVLNQINIRKDERDCLVIKTPYFEEEIITNDVVEIISKNQFKWLGRIDNVINSGGIKLFPEQIENKLKPHIQKEFVISSIPDETFGQKLILIVESSAEIQIDFHTTDLNKYEIPKEIFYLPEFPRTESGKLKRAEILKAIAL